MPSATELQRKLDEFRERFGLLTDLEQAAAVLDWDQQTYMPEEGGGHRAQQLAALAGVIHEAHTGTGMAELLDWLQEQAADLAEDDAAAVRVARRDFERERKLPRRLVEELSRSESEGQLQWQEARRRNDFSLFLPALTRIISLVREKAEHIGYVHHPWDALHDGFEPGSDARAVQEVFGPLRVATLRLLERIRASGAGTDDEILYRDWPEEAQESFARSEAERFGFDFRRGRLDRAVHPFATSFGNRDVRITTRYDRSFLSTAVFGIFHEAGHGMYEQGIADGLMRSPLGTSASLAVHESQSRLWENLIGRSEAYWQYAWPKLLAAFPGVVADGERDGFIRAINQVAPSLIRVEADEVTYNLHIMIRFELELALLDGSLEPAGLPDAWNALYRDQLGITPPDDVQGCLQDVHWSAGLFGYFPTYTLGNVMSVQLLEAHRVANPELDAQTSRGEFSRLAGWLRDNVHSHGSRYLPQELLERATGRRLDPAPYISYLENKFSHIYGLSEEGAGA